MVKKHKHKEDIKEAKETSNKSKNSGRVTFAKKFGIKQIVAIIAVIVLIVNLTLFSMGKMPSMAFWIILLAVWGAAYLAIRFIKQ